MSTEICDVLAMFLFYIAAKYPQQNSDISQMFQQTTNILFWMVPRFICQ
jgi:hypothetical protein